MTQPDEVSTQLDVIAHLLEARGFAVEVDYGGATVIVWAENWPLLVKVGRRKAGDGSRKSEEAESGREE
jgi:hypothetical protein